MHELPLTIVLGTRAPGVPYRMSCKVGITGTPGCTLLDSMRAVLVLNYAVLFLPLCPVMGSWYTGFLVGYTVGLNPRIDAYILLRHDRTL